MSKSGVDWVVIAVAIGLVAMFLLPVIQTTRGICRAFFG